MKAVQEFFTERLSLRDGVLYMNGHLASEQGDGYRNLLHVCMMLMDDTDDVLYIEHIDTRRLLPQRRFASSGAGARSSWRRTTTSSSRNCRAGADIQPLE